MTQNDPTSGLVVPTLGVATPTARTGNPGMGLDDQVFNRLLKERIIFMGTAVDDPMANAICAQLLLLAAEDPDRDIFLYINSPGGSISAGLAIMDTMQFIRPDVATYCVGLAASMGAWLLAAGTKGKRYALPNSRVMLHQPLIGQYVGPATDLGIQAQEMVRTRNRMYQLMSQFTGQPESRIHEDCDRDKWLDSDQAKDYGVIDSVLQSVPESFSAQHKKAAEEE